MEQLKYPGTDYLIDASLESLHRESMAWLNELGFWSDEMTFFYQLLHHSALSKTFPGVELAALEKELVTLNSEKFNVVKNAVADHERLLARIYKISNAGEDQDYREKHKKLADDMITLNQDIRIFKRKVFSFVQK